MREYSESEVIQSRKYDSMIMDAEDAVRKFFPTSGGIGYGGMAGTAYPKLIPKTAASMMEQGTLSGTGYSIYGGGSTSDTFDSWESRLDVSRRYPLGAATRDRKERANKREFDVIDVGLFEHSRWIREGVYERINGDIELAVVEASGINRDGQIIPSLSVDSATSSIEKAKSVIIEVNTHYGPLTGLHDIYYTRRNNITPISNPLDRVGKTHFDIPESKIKAIVLSNETDSEKTHYRGVSSMHDKITGNIINTLNDEIAHDPALRDDYFTMQPGAGPVSSGINKRITEIESEFYVWGEVVPSSWVVSKGDNIRGISASVSYDLPGDRKYREELLENIDEYSKNLVLRPYEICNNPEIISRFSHVTLQQAIEINLFGAANISHIGSSIYGGIGGSVDHSRPAHLVILALPSTTGNGKVSRIVPMIFNVDIPHQDIDIVVTENGVADIRGLSPLRRAEEIIKNCASDAFKDTLWKYYEHLKGTQGQMPMDIKYALELSDELGLNL